MSSSSWTLKRFLSRLASEAPAPGGGSAAAVSAAMGAALGGMVCRIILSRPDVTAVRRRGLKEALRRLEICRKRSERLIQKDAQAYQALVKAFARKRGVAGARRRAVAAPVQICEAAAQAHAVIRRLDPWAGKYLVSDLKAARGLLRGAFGAAHETARINFTSVKKLSREDRWFKARLEKLKRTFR